MCGVCVCVSHLCDAFIADCFNNFAIILLYFVVFSLLLLLLLLHLLSSSWEAFVDFWLTGPQLSSALLGSVQFSSAIFPIAFFLFLIYFLSCFLCSFSFLFAIVTVCVCVCVCAPTCFWLDTSHTRTYTRIHMRHTHTHRHTETSTWPFRRLHPPHCKIRSPLYILCMYGT